jgi:hypothetical protein
VRRIPASLLLLLISFSLISPLLAAPAGAKLPACCRRDGKHRCAAMQSQMHQSGGLKIATSVCAQYPQSKATPVVSGGFMLENNVALLAFRALESVALADEFQRQSFLSHKQQERGPPTFSL